MGPEVQGRAIPPNATLIFHRRTPRPTLMKETPLTLMHRTLKAKLVDFAGWLMPMQYTGVLDEYHAVRHGAGLFDVSHMGRINVAGAQAEAFLQWISTNDVGRCWPWVRRSTAWFAKSREAS